MNTDSMANESENLPKPSDKSLENFVETLIQAIKQKDNCTLNRKPAETAELNQILNENERICRETEEFYAQWDENEHKAQLNRESCTESDSEDINNFSNTRPVYKYRRRHHTHKRKRERQTLPDFESLNKWNGEEMEWWRVLLSLIHPNREFYEAIAAADPNFGFDNEASRTLAILRATNQLNQNSNAAMHSIQTIVIDDPNQDRTDPTYVVDFTQSHCNKYELKLMKGERIPRHICQIQI